MAHQTGRRTRQADRAVTLQAVRVLFAAMGRSARAIESHTGITNAQLFLLQQLAETGGLSVNQLAERVHTRQNTVSSVVGRLTAAGMVAKTRSPVDRRRAVLALTAKGRRTLARAPRPVTAALIAGFDILRPQVARALAGGLQSLVLAMELPFDDAPLLFEEHTHRG